LGRPGAGGRQEIDMSSIMGLLCSIKAFSTRKVIFFLKPGFIIKLITSIISRILLSDPEFSLFYRQRSLGLIRSIFTFPLITSAISSESIGFTAD
jgi:hypothetical protein